MKLICYKGFYSPELCQRYPQLPFVFGDNKLRVGKGGQAIIRDERNAIGVVTKRSPGEYMVEGSTSDMYAVLDDLREVERVLVHTDVVIPITAEGKISLGLGLAELPQRAPSIYGFIEAWFEKMKREVGYVTIKP